MDYNGTRSASSLQSPSTNQNFSESSSNHSNEGGVLSPTQHGNYDEKQQYQYQTQAPSLNQLLQNNHCGHYVNVPLRPSVSSSYHNNYWNLYRPTNETTCVQYNQIHDSFPQHINNVSCSKVDKIASNNQLMETNNLESNYKFFPNNGSVKYRPILNDRKVNNSISNTLSPKEMEKKSDKLNSSDMSDSGSVKPESYLNAEYISNTSCTEGIEKNDMMYHNSNYPVEMKMNQSQLNANYGPMMMHPNANYYSQMRYASPQNNYMNPGINPMMNNNGNRPVIYPPYMHHGYNYPQMAMHNTRPPYNINTPYMPRVSQTPYVGPQDVYMNGSLYGGVIKESVGRKDDGILLATGKQDTSDSGSISNKSATAKSSKSKNAKKNESHPTTPVSNNVPSPSQTSMSSVIDDNEDSMSSHGHNDTNIMHHPTSQYNQHQIPPNIPQNPSIMYPQPPFSSNNTNNSNQIPHPNIGPYPGHMTPQPRPFTPTASRQYHHSNETQINNTCFQKLLELGPEPERGPWTERYLKFMQENNSPLIAVPMVVKQPLDLFRLYHAVRERGGLLNVVKTKRWKEICNIVNVNASASGAYTLRRNYIKCLLDYECHFDRNGVDPTPILQEIQSLSDKKKKSTTRTPGSSSSSSGPVSQLNADFGLSSSSTPRPSLPPPDFNQYSGHNPYNNPLHNGPIIHRSPMPYPTQRSPYPPGPRMMPYNTPPSPMHSQPNVIPTNWPKPVNINQQQWPSPSSSSNSNSTHPMQMPMSPDTPSNSISNSSQQSQPSGDNIDTNPKENVKLDSRYFSIHDNAPKIQDTFVEKDIDKQETSLKPEPSYYNQPYPAVVGQDNSYDYYQSNKTVNQSIQQQPGFSFSRQYGPQYRQPAHNSLVFPNYYQPGIPPVSSNMPNSSTTNSPYYPIGSLQEHTRRMEWKSNYGGMPPPAAPPPPQPQLPTQVAISLPSCGMQGSSRGLLPPNVQQPIPLNPQQYHHSTNMSHCTYPTNQTHSSTSLHHQQRPNINAAQLMPPQQTRHMLPTALSNLPDPLKGLSNVSASVSVNSGPGSLHNMSSANSCHNRSHLDNNRSTQSYNQSQFSNVHKPSSNLLKRYDHYFPPNCVETTLPDFSKKRKYNTKDIKSFNATTVTMALKSGLVAEVSWALNYLTIWSRDESFVDKLSLKNIMPLFQALIDVWRHCLGSVFSYDLFINDLELPLSFEDDEGQSDFGISVRTWQEDNCKQEMKKEIIGEKNGMVVKLDERRDLCEEMEEDVKEITEEKNKRRKNNLSDLWEIGGSDSTLHIMPPMLSQRSTNQQDLLHENGIEESLLFEISDKNEDKVLRCQCVSLIIRNLSFVVGNDKIMGNNKALLVILGRLLSLGHVDEESEEECCWWSKWMEDIREHVLVTLINIASYLDLDCYHEVIVQPIIAGLLHWLTCQSPMAQDPLAGHRVLNCRRLALECVMRLCVHDRNIDYIISSPASMRDKIGDDKDRVIQDLFHYLATAFCCPDVQVVKEMSLAVMHYLSSGGDSDLGSLYLANAEPNVIGGLISFIEATESQIRHIVDTMGMEALQARPELMGTSLELLRHSGSLLTRIAAHACNRSRFTREHEVRMLSLVISTVLDQTVAQSISAVLYLLSTRPYTTQQTQQNLMFRSFLAFDDLSFCEKELTFVPTEKTDNGVPHIIIPQTPIVSMAETAVGLSHMIIEPAPSLSLEETQDEVPHSIIPHIPFLSMENNDNGVPHRIIPQAPSLSIEETQDGVPHSIIPHLPYLMMEGNDNGIPHRLIPQAPSLSIEETQDRVPHRIIEPPLSLSMENNDNGVPHRIIPQAPSLSIEETQDGVPHSIIPHLPYLMMEGNDNGIPHRLIPQAPSLSIEETQDRVPHRIIEPPLSLSIEDNDNGVPQRTISHAPSLSIEENNDGVPHRIIQ